LIALLGVSLFILGCDDSSDDSTQAAEQAAQELVKDLGGDEFAVATGGGNVELRKNTTAVPVTVPDGVTLDTKTFTLAATTLTVNGTVKLGASATPTGAVTVGGKITVDGAGVELDMTTQALTLTEGGVLETKGGGTVEFGATTFSGVGTWTASATGGTAEAGVSGVKLQSAATGATISLVPGSGTRTAGILTAGGTPIITQAAVGSNDLAISAGITIALGGVKGTGTGIVGQLVLAGDGTNPGKITLADNTSVVSTGNTPGNAVFGTAATIGGKTPTTTTIAVTITTTGNGAAGDFAKMVGGSGGKALDGGNADTIPITIDGSQAVA
jgi:hypothetical protein